MAWIELHDTLPEHYKTEELALKLDISVVQAVGHLACLWLKAIRFKPGGVLRGVSNSTIAKWSIWPGSADPFVQALIDTGFLKRMGGKIQGLKLHDWEVYTKSYRKAVADRERKRRGRGRGKSADVPRTGAVDRNDRNMNDQTGTEHLSDPSQPSISTAAQIAAAWRINNNKTMAQDVVQRHVQQYLDQGMNAKTAMVRAMSPDFKGKPWDIFEPLIPNNGTKVETMAERRIRKDKARDLKAEAGSKFSGGPDVPF